MKYFGICKNCISEDMLGMTEENRHEMQDDASWIISSTFIIFTMQSGMYSLTFCLL